MKSYNVYADMVVTVDANSPEEAIRLAKTHTNLEWELVEDVDEVSEVGGDIVWSDGERV